MKFGEVPVDAAVGCVLAHSVRLPDGALKKGMVLDAESLRRLVAAGIEVITVARLDPGDVGENQAAAAIARALAGTGVSVGAAVTGRVNLHAAAGGLLELDTGRIDAANSVNEGLTVATLPAGARVDAGQMLATIKIIPYAVSSAVLGEVVARLRGAAPALSVAAWGGIRAGLVMTRLANTGPAVLGKMRRAVLQRLAPLCATLDGERVVPHETPAIASALRELMQQSPAPDLLLVSGIAATVDREDVVPRGIVRSGGRILHAGMPVDPGNLLLLAEMPRGRGLVPVVGIPTCARSPRLNGFDFVLRRLAARLPVDSVHIASMGVGGLLTEIESRPRPREAGED